MNTAAIYNSTHPLPTALTVQVCDSFSSRLKGFMFSRGVSPDSGLLLVQDSESRLNSAIHMFFVNFDLGVVWVSRDLKVVDRVYARRWAPFYQPCAPAYMIMEFHPSRLDEFSIGDTLVLDYA